MPSLENILEYAIALFIACLLSALIVFLTASFLINSTVDDVANLVNDFSAVCDSNPIGDNDLQFEFKGETIYCKIYRRSVMDYSWVDQNG